MTTAISPVRSRVLLSMLAVMALGALMLALPVARADGPPGPAPYPKIFVSGADDPGMGYLECWDTDGSQIYDGRAWTLEPLVRGPLFAPVVLWLADAGQQAVAPLEFHSFADLSWRTVDDGPLVTSQDPVGPVGGRPVGYGPAATDPAPRVTCTSMDPQGWYDFGDYYLTAGLVKTLSLPESLVGRTVNFDNEGTVTFTVPRTQFPLTAGTVRPTLPTADWAKYYRQPLGSGATTCKQGTSTRYSGAATTFAPLVRGFQWAPMALWLTGDRIATPRWFTTNIRGTWRTTTGSPALRGTLASWQQGTPTAYGAKPANTANDVVCTSTGSVAKTITVTKTLAAQLSLPAGLVGRQVALDGTFTSKAYVAAWLFPPAN